MTNPLITKKYKSPDGYLVYVSCDEPAFWTQFEKSLTTAEPLETVTTTQAAAANTTERPGALLQTEFKTTVEEFRTIQFDPSEFFPNINPLFKGMRTVKIFRSMCDIVAEPTASKTTYEYCAKYYNNNDYVIVETGWFDSVEKCLGNVSAQIDSLEKNLFVTYDNRSISLNDICIKALWETVSPNRTISSVVFKMSDLPDTFTAMVDHYNPNKILLFNNKFNYAVNTSYCNLRDKYSFVKGTIIALCRCLSCGLTKSDRYKDFKNAIINFNSSPPKESNNKFEILSVQIDKTLLKHYF